MSDLPENLKFTDLATNFLGSQFLKHENRFFYRTIKPEWSDWIELVPKTELNELRAENEQLKHRAEKAERERDKYERRAKMQADEINQILEAGRVEQQIKALREWASQLRHIEGLSMHDVVESLELQIEQLRTELNEVNK